LFYGYSILRTSLKTKLINKKYYFTMDSKKSKLQQVSDSYRYFIGVWKYFFFEAHVEGDGR
jgi:hypothetical protein